jgi:hypothetical protein
MDGPRRIPPDRAEFYMGFVTERTGAAVRVKTKVSL